jgi:hypothetical protein
MRFLLKIVTIASSSRYGIVQLCRGVPVSIEAEGRAIVCGAFEGMASSTMLTVIFSKEAMAHTVLSRGRRSKEIRGIDVVIRSHICLRWWGRDSVTPSLSGVCTTDVH